jgi:ABC-2 type transport system ATP-binding protein
MSNAVEIDQLVVDRGRARVINTMTVAIPEGGITGLVGPSGSGKTTLMRTIVGVQVVRSGTVKVLGEAAGSKALRSRIGYLTQAPSVYPDLTVRENTRYFASLYGVSPERADDLLARVGLTSQADQLVGTLSGGQPSRCSLGCALVGDPELLVLDEPTVGQDPLLRDELWAQFRSLAAAGTTIIVSSHVMDEANRCDRLLLIRGGKIIADDTPAAVKSEAGTNDLDAAFLTLVRRQEGMACL